MMVRGVYKRYPFNVPARVRFFNLFRLPFRVAFLEEFLETRIALAPDSWWRKLIPPIYFYPAGSIREVQRRGLRYHLDLSKQLDHAIYFHTVKDKAWDNLLSLIRPDFHVIDAGANVGYLTLQFASRCAGGKVYGFEPDSRTFEKLSRNVRLNGFEQVSLFRVALADKEGTAQLFRLYDNNPGANRILPEKPASYTSSEPVAVTTLDHCWEKQCFDRVDLIKLDVEGFELLVLRGGERLIRRYQPLMFIELVDVNLAPLGHSSKDLLHFVRGLGYTILEAKTMKPLDPAESHYTDILCVPDNGHRL